MDQLLTDADVRVLGALIEKEITTPDHYPLSLNALTAACNQTTNRHPVVSFDEATVLEAIQHLRHQSLVRGIQRMDSRVTKYEHLATEALSLSSREMAVMCVLLLRGAQTLGELRTRTERLAQSETLGDVEATITALTERAPPFVTRLARQAGQKEVRYAHLLSGEIPADVPEVHAPAAAEPRVDRLGAIEETTHQLRAELAELQRQFAEFRKQFE
ncbi:MAG: protein yceH [Gemmatimonadetes bacterium]|nr:protein yceH [Gemmatimonadota bacterium]